MAAIGRRLDRHQIIGLDTSIFIYHFEAHRTYLPLTQIILGKIQSGNCRAVVSTITMLELTVHPWRINRPDIARHYELLLANFPNLDLVDVTRDAARRAAQLRARYRLHPADALHVATTMIDGATAWISNDKKLKRLTAAIDVIILDDFLQP